MLIKQKTISQVVKEFLNSELYGQRSILIQLLIKSNESEYQYLAYLLYDLLSNENNGNVDTIEQTLLYDSLPWNIKKYFRDAMKQTINYTNNLSNSLVGVSKILSLPNEQTGSIIVDGNALFLQEKEKTTSSYIVLVIARGLQLPYCM